MKTLAQQIIDIQNAINAQSLIENRLGNSVVIELDVRQLAVLSYALGIASGSLLPPPREPPPYKSPPPVKTKGVRGKR